MICLLTTLSVAAFTLLNLHHFDLVALFMSREGLDVSVFTIVGSAWILIACLAFFLGSFLARICLPNRPYYSEILDFRTAADITFILNVGLLCVTFLWIFLSAQKIGGITKLAELAYIDSLNARDLLLENKLFTGMRLFYAALPATGCFAAAILAKNSPYLSRRSKAFCIITIALNTVALFILPLVMSQRLLLLQFLLSLFLVTCIVRKKVVGLRVLCFAATLFLATWILRESITNPLIHRSAFDIGLQKLAFYFVNDLWNGFAPLQTDVAHTFGAVSMRGLMFLTFTEGTLTQALHPRLMELDNILGGGDFPFFTAAFVDFGAIGGAVFIAGCAAIFQVLYHRSTKSMAWGSVYAQAGAALLFSTHGIYFTHQNFLFSVGIIGLINLLSVKQSHIVAPHRAPSQHA